MLDAYRRISPWKRPFHQGRAQIAKWWAKANPQAEIIGITGSVGKTTTKEAIMAVLSQKFSTLGSIGNLDPVFNIPITLLKIRSWTKKVVLEFGVEYPSEMDFYLSLVRPKIGVVTKIYWTHTQFLGDIAGVIREKSKLLKALPSDGWAVLNHDDEYVREQMAKMTQAKIFWYGSHPHKVDLQIADFLPQGVEGSSFKLKNNKKEIDIRWPLIGEHNTTCAAAAASVGLLGGLTLAEIKKGLEKLEPLPHRLDVHKGPKGSIILDDSYNSSPAAAIMAIETLRSLAREGRAIALLGEMLELGSYAKEGHREVGRKIAQDQIDFLIVFDDLTKFIAEEAVSSGMAANQTLVAKNRQEAYKKLREMVKKDDVVLIKGSRATKLDEVVEKLLS